MNFTISKVTIKAIGTILTIMRNQVPRVMKKFA